MGKNQAAEGGQEEDSSSEEGGGDYWEEERGYGKSSEDETEYAEAPSNADYGCYNLVWVLETC